MSDPMADRPRPTYDPDCEICDHRRMVGVIGCKEHRSAAEQEWMDRHFGRLLTGREPSSSEADR